MKGGQTISEYATSLGKDPQTVVDALTNAATTKLDELVADGKITQERADTVKGKLPARIDTLDEPSVRPARSRLTPAPRAARTASGARRLPAPRRAPSSAPGPAKLLASNLCPRRCPPWPISRSTSTRTSSRSRSGSTTSPRTSSAPPPTSGTSGRRPRGRSSRRRPRSASTRWSSCANAFADPTGLTLAGRHARRCAGATPASRWRSSAARSRSPGIIANGTPEQIGEWVPQCFGTPEKIQLGAFCVSEPDAGSDVSSLRTRAVYDEAKDEWVLNGTKTWITNGGIADVHVDRRVGRPRARGSRARRASSCRRARRACARARSSRSTASAPATPPRSSSTTCASRVAACSAARRSSTSASRVRARARAAAVRPR